MVNGNDPFKYKIDAVVNHAVYGPGKICTLHSKPDADNNLLRFYWIRFLNGEIITDCLEQDLTLIK